ncbi:MAG: hypothetical protein SAqPseu_33360 [Shewanella algae]
MTGSGGTVTVENKDVFVEATWAYSLRVTGSPVQEPTAGDGLQLSWQLKPGLLVIFGSKP